MSDNIKEPIKLKKLIDVLQSAYDRHKDRPEIADNLSVEFWLGEEWVDLDRIGQFGLVPDVTITLKRAASTQAEAANDNEVRRAA